MAIDNRLVQEFQQNTFRYDIGTTGSSPGGSEVSLSGLYGGVMPYRQSPTGGLSDALVTVSGLATPGETDSTSRNPINKVCLFENEIHNLAQGQWHRQNKTTGAWELLGTFEGAHSSNRSVGLYPFFDESTNRRYLASAYLGSAGNTWRAVRWNSSLGVMESGNLTTLGVSTTAFPTTEVQHENKLYFDGLDSAVFICVLDPMKLQMSALQVQATSTVSRPVKLCSYSGILYYAYRETSATYGAVGGSGNIFISKVLPTIQRVAVLPFEDLPVAGCVTTNYNEQRCLFFVDNNPATSSGQLNGLGVPNQENIWVYYMNNPRINPTGGGSVNVQGYSVWRLQGDGNEGLDVVEQIDSLMGGYRAGLHQSISSAWSYTQAVISYCNNYPGWFTVSPDYGILTLRPFGGEPGQTFRQWNFNPFNGDTPSGGADLGGPAKVSFVEDGLGGGARWSPAATSTTIAQDVNIFDIVYSSGVLLNSTTWRIYYELNPSTAYHAGTQVNVRWYYNKYHAPDTRCNLVNSSHGSLGTNEVNNVIMSSGISYSVDWDFSNGLSRGNRVNLVGLIYLNSSDIGDL